MSQHARFHIVFDGPALAEGTMDVRELAPALLSVGDLVERANALLNGDAAKVVVNVRASFKKGSFGIDMESVQSLGQQAVAFLTGSTVTSIINLAGLLGLGAGTVTGVVRVVKWMRGRAVSKVEPLENGVVRLWIGDEHLETEGRVLQLLEDYRIRKSLEELIAKPLSKPGVNRFAVANEGVTEILEEVDAESARYFVAPAVVERVMDSQVTTELVQLVNLAFKDDNKWRFTNGAQPFYASMLDEAFMARFEKNEIRIGHDDIFKVTIRRTQRIAADGLKIDVEILNVIEHRSAAPQVQLRLPLSGGADETR